MVREQRQVEHVRVADQDLGRILTDSLSFGRRRVPVVDGGPDRFLRSEAADPVLDHLVLVLFQGLERKQVQGLGVRVPEDALEDRERVRKRLSARCGRGHGDVFAPVQAVQRPGLMDVELFDAQLAKDVRDAGFQGRIRFAVDGRQGREDLVVGDLPGKSRMAP